LEVLLLLSLMLAVAKIMGYIFERLGQPAVLGQIFGGLLLGLFIETNPVISEFANLGVLLLLFIAGLESELEEFKKVGKRSVIVAVFGVVVAFLFGFLVALPFTSFERAIIYGALMTPTSVSITVKVLMEMRKLNTIEGTTILAAAVVDDILGIIVLTFAISIARRVSIEYLKVMEVLVSVSALIFFFLYFGPRLAETFFRRLRIIDLPEVETAFAIVFLVLFSYLAEHLNLASILGAYLVGLAIGQTSQKKVILDHVNILGYSLFIPVFFVEVGMKMKAHHLLHVSSFAILYTLMAIVSKIVGCGIGAKLSGFNWRSSLKIGVGMIPRMGVELAMLSIAISAGVMDLASLTVIVVMVFVTTLITPPLLKVVYMKT